jgi:hypothetical protein
LQTCSSLLCSWRDRSLPTPQSPGPLLQRRIREVTVNQINECLVAAKNAFPDAESFTDVPGTRPAGMSF